MKRRLIDTLPFRIKDGKAKPRRFMPHYWAWCPLCGMTVICGGCGNNCCNAGGFCRRCKSARALADKGRHHIAWWLSLPVVLWGRIRWGKP